MPSEFVTAQASKNLDRNMHGYAVISRTGFESITDRQRHITGSPGVGHIVGRVLGTQQIVTCERQ
ncbi:Uncharacterised protein [Mycobacteroides abscessus subsp. massiliense]|nr:Uncharacterised protein [Mycobacteroides abscessus subsp. massiliense]